MSGNPPSQNFLPPARSESFWSNFYHYLLLKPERETLIDFASPEERERFSKRALQRLGADVDQYKVFNIHKIGIDVPSRYVFEELLTWNRDSEHWPNRLAGIKRIDGELEHIEIMLFGIDRLFSFAPLNWRGIPMPPLFALNKIKFNSTPGAYDVDNARSLLYRCSGGYPIGIFAMYVRSSIAEENETETSQLFFIVAFNFFGTQSWIHSRLTNPVWELIHDRATANILNRAKQICEYKFNNVPIS